MTWVLRTIAVGLLGGYVFYVFIYPVSLIPEDTWNRLLIGTLVCAVGGCGYVAAFKESAPWIITTFSAAFTLGHWVGGGYFLPTTFEGAMVVLVFIISYLAGHLERKAIGKFD